MLEAKVLADDNGLDLMFLKCNTHLLGPKAETYNLILTMKMMAQLVISESPAYGDNQYFLCHSL